MNGPRVFTNLDDLEVEAFPVNDERALEDEVSRMDAAGAWARSGGEERAAMKVMVREALLRLADDVDLWLPRAIVARSESRFGFFVLWKNRHLEEEVVRMRASAERDSEQRLVDLQRMAGRRRASDGTSS